MFLSSKSYLFVLAVLLALLSSIAQLINHLVYHFPGNNYFPPQFPGLALIIFLIYYGLRLYFGKSHLYTARGLELIYLFMTMSLIAFASNAIQLTPFPPIDTSLNAFEQKLGINLLQWMHWTTEYPYFYKLLNLIYASLAYQMCFIPLIILFMGKFYLLRDYYLLLIFTALIGFTCYYLFPTTAPASVLVSPLFSPYQLATGIKFNQIHHHIMPTTIEGGLIALPSFHTIWALLCIYLVKEWCYLRILMIAINSLLIAACVSSWLALFNGCTTRYCVVFFQLASQLSLFVL